MPVYLFTFHAYQSWMPDHERGYTRRDAGVVPTDEEMAENYRRKARFEPVVFTSIHQKIIVDKLLSVCHERSITCHYAVAVDSHVHPLVSWRDEHLEVNDVYIRLKQACGFELAQHFKTKGRPYFSRGGHDDRKQVADRDHFEHLMTRYLPDHVGYTFSERNQK